MIKDYTPARYVTITDHELVFDDGHGNGYGFPCDESGHLLAGLVDAAAENYNWCMEHPEKFVRWNRIISRQRRYHENATGRCSCGEKIELWGAFNGACDCPKCGQWYNLFGQELLPPEQWED